MPDPTIIPRLAAIPGRVRQIIEAARDVTTAENAHRWNRVTPEECEAALTDAVTSLINLCDPN
jgi:hypothetical protein